MHEGGCHCGAVRFGIHGEIEGFQHCHCWTCRKIPGTVYGSSAITPAEGFRITAGEAQLRRYASSPGKWRSFCANCGSHVFATYERHPEWVVLRLGTVDTLGEMQAQAHIWVSQKAPWYRILDGLPQFPEGSSTP
jgi:hypothetical protein